jgi:hypothetical protein
MLKIFTLVFVIVFASLTSSYSQTTSLRNLYKPSDSRSRSISPENFTGEKGKGGMAIIDENANSRSRKLGQGWKVSPKINIEAGESFTLAEINESGVINHIWMTPSGVARLMILRFYWDDETEASVEVPLGDFFAAGWGMKDGPFINSIPIAVNPGSGFNSFWQMPFRKKCKITVENRNKSGVGLYYQIDYSLEEVAEDTQYFHAQFRRVNKLPYKEVFTIVDNIKGKGNYVGTYLAHGAREKGWWGEGEIKFYMDGDKDFPTICGTGEEDYFLGSYGYNEKENEGKLYYTDFSGLYSGFHIIKDKSIEGFIDAIGQYRWHIQDPIRFEKDLKITIQSLAWRKETYLPLEDDLASVAYWYQNEPHNPFPELPSNENLIIKKKE